MINLLKKMKIVSFCIILISVLYSGVSFSITDSSSIQITHFEFGKITINDATYTKDISIWPDGKIESGPEDMHFMSTNDFKELFNSGIKKLVIGTGAQGKVEMDISRKIEKTFKNHNVELILMRTEDLVKFLNETPERDFLVFVHLTC